MLNVEDLNLSIYSYEFTKAFPIPGFILAQLLESMIQNNRNIIFHFDLDITYIVRIFDRNLARIKLLINNETIKEINLNISELGTKIDKKSLYIIYSTPKAIYKAEIFSSQGYLKIFITDEMKSSTLNINGIHMHQVSKYSPYIDSSRKVQYARIKPGERVLDICTGLGYTAISAARRGARQVITIEINQHVLGLAETNPWSYYLGSKKIFIINDNAIKVLPLIRDSSFDKVIHDPPRFNVAGELYSLSFYKEIYRVLRPGGVLFHYTGKPMMKRGRGLGPIVKGIRGRLERAGFIVARYLDDVYGFIAVKPR